MKNTIVVCIVYILTSSFLVQGQKANFDDCYLSYKHMDTIQTINVRIQTLKEHVLKSKGNCSAYLYHELGQVYETISKPDSSLYYYNRSISIAKKLNNSSLLAAAYCGKSDIFIDYKNKEQEASDLLREAKLLLLKESSEKGWLHYYNTQSSLSANNSDYTTAITYIDTAITIATKMKDSISLGRAYHNKGYLNRLLSNYNEASVNMLKSIKIKEELKMAFDLNKSYYSLAFIHYPVKQYDLTIKYAKKSISLSKVKKDELVILLNHLLLSPAYRKSDQYNLALKATDSALVLAKKLELNNQVSRIFKEKGWIHFEKDKDYKNAENSFLKAYELIKRTDDHLNIYVSLQGLVQVYIATNNLKKAKKYLELYEKVATKINSIRYTSFVYKSYGEFYEKSGDFDSALTFYKRFNKLNDSIANSGVQTKLANLEKQYDIKSKELQIVKLSQKNTTQEKLTQEANFKRNLYLITAIFLGVFLLIGFWIYFKLKRQEKSLIKANKELVEVNTVKNRLFSIISHDLRGMLIPFQRTGKIVKYHIDNNNQARAVTIAQELEKNSESLSIMLDNLLIWSLDQMNGYTYNSSEIILSEELVEIIESFKQHAKYKDTKIKLEFTKDLVISFDKGAFHVIFRNLISNALKYTEKGTIKIVFKKELDTLHCSISDSGIGMDNTQLNKLFNLENNTTTTGTQGEKGTGIGLNLVNKFVSLNKGTISVTSKEGKGSCFDLSFPLPTISIKNDGKNLKQTVA